MFFKFLPDNVVTLISKKLVDGFLNKYADINIEGMENLKNLENPVIFISNHLSNSDGLVLNKVLEAQDVTFVAGIKLSQNKFTNLGTHVVKTITITPNSADKDAMSSIIKTVKSGNNILVFPEGTRSRTGALMEARRGILLIQKFTKADIIPIGVCGSEKLLPINNLGMEKEKFQHARVNIKIGKAVKMLEKNQNENKHEFDERSMKHIMKAIAQLLPEEYRGVYKD
ncbi:MAG: 1-acyl-sn-glycerol-3-phosphate acyltransferase [Clostridiaceae bacterium]|nr:1-acyl-sn-glycerol-3-phosphate acyltransferase [Clostridiaceae bacterium]